MQPFLFLIQIKKIFLQLKYFVTLPILHICHYKTKKVWKVVCLNGASNPVFAIWKQPHYRLQRSNGYTHNVVNIYTGKKRQIGIKHHNCLVYPDQVRKLAPFVFFSSVAGSKYSTSQYFFLCNYLWQKHKMKAKWISLNSALTLMLCFAKAKSPVKKWVTVFCSLYFV